MSEKKITINLHQYEKDEYDNSTGEWHPVTRYQVLKVVNSLKPKVGDRLTEEQVQSWIDIESCTVNITKE